MSEDISSIAALGDTVGIDTSPFLAQVSEDYEIGTGINVIETVFQNVLRHTITGDNNITTYYVENGINYEDTTTTNPLTVTIQGWMAELFYESSLFQRPLEIISQLGNIPVIGGFIASELSSIAFVLEYIYDYIRKYVEALRKLLFANWSQESGYEDDLITFDESKKLGFQLAVLEGVRQKRLPINAVIPRVGIFHNMMLKNYEWDQDKSYYQAKLTLTLQQMRNTSTLLTRVANSTVTVREAEPSVLKDETKVSDKGQQQYSDMINDMIDNGWWSS